MARMLNIAVAGAAGEVGKALIAGLDECALPVASVYALDQVDEEETSLLFRERPLPIETADDFDFRKVDVLLSALPADCARDIIDAALAAGCQVIDASAASRFADDAQLVVAGLGGPAGSDWRLVACPDPSVTMLAPLLQAVELAVGLSRVQVTLLRAASSEGAAGVRELARQTGELLNGRGIEPAVYGQQLAFNLLPCEAGEQAGHSAVEQGFIRELRAVLDQPDLPVDVTAVSVPVFYGHAAVLNVETVDPLPIEAARRLLRATESVELQQADAAAIATPIAMAERAERVHIDRLRPLAEAAHGFQAWVVADNIRHGVVFQMLSILEKLPVSSKKPL